MTVFDQNGLNVVVSWVLKDTHTSFTNNTFDSLSQSSNSTHTPLEIISDVYSLSNCTSGVIAIDSSVDQYVIQYLGDRY